MGELLKDRVALVTGAGQGSERLSQWSWLAKELR